ncbi:MAG TPA: GIY-YIG nuclease family protein [Solirubrobacteraceae bacterium]|nr:GIY-YIG nuclease family protein [Solirubrobacteraceae bacterium]
MRRLTALADALGIEVEIAHRALPDAETCARVLCALFPRLCANAATVADAVALLAPRRPRRPARPGGLAAAPARAPDVDFAKLPRDPGVYLFRDARGATLYVGKSVSIRTRARAHFAPASGDAEWTAHAAIVDYRATQSELGALVLENRLIKELGPPGNVRLTRRDDRLVYLRCRLDIPFPILEVAREPAAGHAVTIGPLHGRRLVLELAEQLDSLFGLRHCGRRLPRRQHPSAYGQMGRCLSPCLGDLDPNLYRSRLDEALSLFIGDAGGGRRLLAYVEAQMRSAAAERRYERAAWLRRRLRRLEAVLGRLGGVLQATHAQPRLVLAGHPTEARFDAFWLVGGRVADWGAVTREDRRVDRGGVDLGGLDRDALDALAARTDAALSRLGGHRGVGTHVPPDEVDEVRIVGNWLASHPETPMLVLDPAPDRRALAEFVAGAAGAPRARELQGVGVGADVVRVKSHISA